MRLQPGAPDLAASVDGSYVVCAGERLTLWAQATRAELASLPLDGPADVAFVGADRLLVIVPGDGRSQLSGYALPSLERVATLELEGRLAVVSAVGTRALVATESLEQPRVVAVTTKILVEAIPLREPLAGGHRGARGSAAGGVAHARGAARVLGSVLAAGAVPAEPAALAARAAGRILGAAAPLVDRRGRPDGDARGVPLLRRAAAGARRPRRTHRRRGGASRLAAPGGRDAADRRRAAWS